MSNMLLKDYPIMVLPKLAVLIGLNEAIVLQQLYWLLNKPECGKILANQKWIFNTYEQWQEYFPFWQSRTIRQIFTNLSKMKLIEFCQPEGRISRRKYYRITDETIKALTEAAESVTSKRHEMAHGKRQKMALPSTQTSAQTSAQTSKGKGMGASALEKEFSAVIYPKFSYPRTEREMAEKLEQSGFDYVPDYDGNFFAEMKANGWRLPNGSGVYDWMALYDARLRKCWPAHPDYGHF